VHPSIFRDHINIVNNAIDENPGLKVGITFDDGYEGVFEHAFNLLSKSNVDSKIIFPITDYIGRYNEWDTTFLLNRYRHLNNEQIKLMDGDGWEIGSHTKSHRFLSSLNSKQIKLELSESKDILEQLSGSAVKSIAPPFGLLDQRVYDECVEAGYTKIYVQKLNSVVENRSASVRIRNNIYSIDKNSNIINKLEGSNREKRKENRITALNIVTRSINF
jgi:peptidoglycan/xylan/chitin deacetylase (PgdA/CDA1 family)